MLMFCFVSESEGTENSAVPCDKILECIQACVHVANIDNIVEQKNNLVHLFNVVLAPELSWTGNGVLLNKFVVCLVNGPSLSFTFYNGSQNVGFFIN